MTPPPDPPPPEPDRQDRAETTLDVPRIPDHELLRCIGRGSYGDVWLARNVMGTYRAVKVLYRSRFDHDEPYDREYRGIEQFEPVSRTHEGLVDVLQIGRGPEGNYFYYVMELADDRNSGQSLNPHNYEPHSLGQTVTALKPLPVENCIELGLSLASAVGHLHRHHLVHRDIKPANIIFVNDIPKLADIGLVTRIGAETIAIGTPGYMAPESIPSPQSDIFGLGKVLYEISTGKRCTEFPELPDAERVDDWERLIEFIEIVNKACQYQARNRYQSAEELYEHLLVLKARKSLRNLLRLERIVRFLKKASIPAAALLLLVGLGYYENYRGKRNATRHLAETYAANGTRAFKDDDLLGALPWFAAGLRLEEEDPRRARRYRVHLGLALRQCPRISRMWFHPKDVNQAKFSPDGRYVATSCDDGTVTVWDVQADARHLQLTGHEAAVSTVAFSPQGDSLATAGWDKTARVWDLNSGRQLHRLPHPDTVYSAAFDPDARRLITACADGIARVWDLPSEQILFNLEGHTGGMRHAAYSPDGLRALTVGEDCTARLWDLETRSTLQILQHRKPAGWIYQGSFSPDGRYIATASFDKTVQVLDTRTRLVRSLRHDQGVHSVEFSPDGRYLLTACWDYTARIWSVSDGAEAFPPLTHNSYLWHASFSPSGRQVVTASKLGTACIWDLSPVNWQPPSIQSIPPSPIQNPLPPWKPRRYRSLFCPGGNRYATLDDHRALVWDTASAGTNPVATLTQTGLGIADVKFNAAGTRLLTISPAFDHADGLRRTVQLWDVTRQSPLHPSFTCENSVTNGVLSPDGRLLLALHSGEIRLWDCTTGNLIERRPQTESISRAAFSSDGTMILSVSGSKVIVWDSTDYTRATLLPHSHPVTWAEFDPAGNRVVTTTTPSALAGGEALVWSIRQGKLLTPPLKHGDGVTHASFDPTGKLIVTASEDKTAQVWIAATGERRGPPLRHADEVRSAAFSPDGRFVVTSCRDGTARVWEVDNGQPHTPPLRHTWGTLADAQFDGGNDRILTRRLTGEMKIWTLIEDDRPAWQLSLLANLLAGHLTDETGAAFPLSQNQLQQSWYSLRLRYPNDFAVSPQDALQWHQREEEASGRAKDWAAVLFHLDRMLELTPNDPDLLRRRAQAQHESANKP